MFPVACERLWHECTTATQIEAGSDPCSSTKALPAAFLFPYSSKTPKLNHLQRCLWCMHARASNSPQREPHTLPQFSPPRFPHPLATSNLLPTSRVNLAWVSLLSSKQLQFVSYHDCQGLSVPRAPCCGAGEPGLHLPPLLGGSPLQATCTSHSLASPPHLCRQLITIRKAQLLPRTRPASANSYEYLERQLIR